MDTLNPQVFTLVGAGGKTSLLWQLAREAWHQGRRIAVTTTTHMYAPPAWTDSLEKAREDLAEAGFTVIGKATAGEKMTYGGDDLYKGACELADIVLVEGDGAKGRDFKVPRRGEPVIPDNTTAVLAVAGVQAVGKMLGEACFRYELTGLPANQVLTEDVFAALWRAYYLEPLAALGYRVIPIVNQCDTAALRERGKHILILAGAKGGVLTSCI